MIPPPELSSWKAIAAYLGISVRTAQLWEQTRGLPVRRLPGPRAQVRALPEELAAWKTRIPPADPLEPVPVPVADEQLSPAPEELPPAPAQVPKRHWHARRLTFSLAVLIFTAAVIVTVALRPAAVASVRIEPNGLTALDEHGRMVWQRDFGMLNMIQYASGERRSWVGELGGRRVVLFVPVPVGTFSEPVPLVCLDTRGRERWRFVPGKTVTMGSNTFPPPYIVRQFAVLADKIIVTSHQHPYYPSQIAVLNPQGRLLREYWHPGHLNVLSTGIFHGKQVAFLGGINNLRHAATLVVLDPERFGGAALEQGTPAFDGLPAGVEEARILFNQSCLTSPDPYNQIAELHPSMEEIVVHVVEGFSRPQPPAVLYHFTPDLQLRNVVPSDRFLSLHANATHSLAAEVEHLRQLTIAK